MIALQCCAGFCCTTTWINVDSTTWISHNYIHRPPLSWASPTLSLSHSSRSSQSARQGSLCYASASHGLSHSHMAASICQCSFLNSFPPLLPLLCLQVCSLRLCLHSFPVNRFISTVLHRFLLTSFWPHKPNCPVFACLPNLGAAVCSVCPLSHMDPRRVGDFSACSACYLLLEWTGNPQAPYMQNWKLIVLLLQVFNEFGNPSSCVIHKLESHLQIASWACWHLPPKYPLDRSPSLLCCLHTGPSHLTSSLLSAPPVWTSSSTHWSQSNTSEQKSLYY